MAEISTQEISDSSEWEEFLQKHEEANFLQSWYWGDFHKALGKKIERIGFYQGQKAHLVGVLLAIVEDARRGRYLTVAGGPILDWHKREVVEAFVLALRHIAKKHSCVFVRVRPNLVEDAYAAKLFSDHGFIVSPMHLTADLTRQINLSQTEEEMMAALRKSTRYEIRQAQKLGLTITTTTDPNEIDEFYTMQLSTAKRHGFVPFALPYLKEQFAVFAKNNFALLYRAEYEGRLITEAFMIFYGAEATYHYGASGEEARRIPGAYLLQWEAICEARRRGMKRYNLWGVAPEGATNHRFWGVSVFKRGFGGADVQYTRARDLVISPLKYTLNYAVELTRKSVRRV